MRIATHSEMVNIAGGGISGTSFKKIDASDTLKDIKSVTNTEWLTERVSKINKAASGLSRNTYSCTDEKNIDPNHFRGYLNTQKTFVTSKLNEIGQQEAILKACITAKQESINSCNSIIKAIKDIRTLHVRMEGSTFTECKKGVSRALKKLTSENYRRSEAQVIKDYHTTNKIKIQEQLNQKKAALHTLIHQDDEELRKLNKQYGQCSSFATLLTITQKGLARSLAGEHSGTSVTEVKNAKGIKRQAPLPTLAMKLKREQQLLQQLIQSNSKA